MNNKYKIVLVLAWALVCSTAEVSAQHTYSGYFTDGYLFRHEMNPAAGNEQSYVSMVGIGNVDFSVRGNLGLKHVLYNVNGKTTTFLNPAVSTDEFLSKIKDNNRIRTDLNLQLLGVGFKAFGGYNTIGLSARANVNLNVPGALLRLAKQGIENKTYDISDFRAHAEAYTELAFGHSRDINENLRVGAKLKILIGAGNVDAEFQKAQLALGEDAWTAVTDAKVQASVKGLTYKTETKMRGAEGEKHPHKGVLPPVYRVETLDEVKKPSLCVYIRRDVKKDQPYCVGELRFMENLYVYALPYCKGHDVMKPSMPL